MIVYSQILGENFSSHILKHYLCLAQVKELVLVNVILIPKMIYICLKVNSTYEASMLSTKWIPQLNMVEQILSHTSL